MDSLLRDKLAYLRELLAEVTDLVSFTVTALHESLLLHAPPHIRDPLTQLGRTRERATRFLATAFKHYQTASEALGVPTNGAVFAVATAVLTRVVVHMLLARLTLWRVVKLLLVSAVLSLSTSSHTAAAALPSAPAASSLPASILSALLSQSPAIALSLSSIAQAYWVVGQQVVSLLLTLSGLDADASKSGGSGGVAGAGVDVSGVMGRVVDVVEKLRKELPSSTTTAPSVDAVPRLSHT